MLAVRICCAGHRLRHQADSRSVAVHLFGHHGRTAEWHGESAGWTPESATKTVYQRPSAVDLAAVLGFVSPPVIRGTWVARGGARIATTTAMVITDDGGERELGREGGSPWCIWLH